MIEGIIPFLPLQKLKQKTKGYNFQCMICGDGKRGLTRAWLYNKHGAWRFYCFNCGAKMYAMKFIKDYFPDVYLDVFKQSFKKKKIAPTKIQEAFKESMKLYSKFPAISLDKLNIKHEAVQYVMERKILEDKWHLLNYTDDFIKFTNKLTDDKFKDWKTTDSRLLIPFKKRNGDIFAYQGRSFEKDPFLRYITVKLDEDYPKIFGLERVKWNKPIVVLEGPIDSLHIVNGVAMAGGDCSIENLNRFFNKNQVIILYDLEQRNVQIKRKVLNFLTKGYKVCLLPEYLKKYGDDVNKFIRNGISEEEINRIIHDNIISGKKGILLAKKWYKV